jgi:hypothetical protein
VTLIRYEGDFSPCEEEWYALVVLMFELHLQGVLISGLRSQVVCLRSGCRSRRPNHHKSSSLNLSLSLSLSLSRFIIVFIVIFFALYCILYSLSSLSGIIVIKRKVCHQPYSHPL